MVIFIKDHNQFLVYKLIILINNNEFKEEIYTDEFKKKNKEILKIEKELKKFKKK